MLKILGDLCFEERAAVMIQRPHEPRLSTSRRESLLTGCWLSSAMAQGEDREKCGRSKIKPECPDRGVVKTVSVLLLG